MQDRQLVGLAEDCVQSVMIIQMQPRCNYVSTSSASAGLREAGAAGGRVITTLPRKMTTHMCYPKTLDPKPSAFAL